MKKNLLIVFILTLIFLFYIWIITIGNEPWDQKFPSGWYNVLSDALLKGKLYFLEEFNIWYYRNHTFLFITIT